LVNPINDRLAHSTNFLLDVHWLHYLLLRYLDQFYLIVKNSDDPRLNQVHHKTQEISIEKRKEKMKKYFIQNGCKKFDFSKAKQNFSQTS
jgi:hypothetical protein